MNNWVWLDKLFGPGFNIRTYVSIFFIAIVSGTGGINGCVALWLRKDFKNESNELQNNFKTFLILTIIVNSFVSINLRKIWKLGWIPGIMRSSTQVNFTQL